MELTLKRLLEHAEFKKYRGKGYDPTEVDDFLDKAAAMAGKVEVQLTQALEAARAAESAGGGSGAPDPAAVEAEVERRVAERVAELEAARPTSAADDAEQSSRILVMAQRTADDTIAAARADAEELATTARAQAEELTSAARTQAEELTVATRAEADATLTEAQAAATAMREEADQLLATTRAEVEAEAARERREARQRLAAEIAELEGVRESLRSDVNVLERHVEEQRSQLGSTLAELQQILDDPSGFRMAPPPALVDPDIPDLSDVDEDAEAPADEAVAEAAPEPEADAEPAVDVDVEVEEAEVVIVVDEEPEPAAPADEPPAPTGFDQEPSPQALDFGDVDHRTPGLDEPSEGGPPTAPVSAVDLGVGADIPARTDDDPFLAELRKAMADDEPLGPRDEEQAPGADTLFDDEDRRGWRFGRRR